MSVRDFDDSARKEFEESIVGVVGNNIERILRITKGTAFFDEQLGTRLRNLNFKIMDEDLRFKCMHIIMADLPSQEPRAVILPNLSSVEMDHDRDILRLVIAFRIRNDKSSSTYSRDIKLRV